MTIPIDLTDLIKTTDRAGYLKPSYLGTTTAEYAKAAGMVEDVLTENGSWARLTVAGMHYKYFVLRDPQ